MEKSEQNEVEYMRQIIDTRLQPECMKHLTDAITTVEGLGTQRDYLNSRSSFITDKDNWFYDNSLKELTEQMFYQDWDNYYKYHIVKKDPPPKFELESLWVNYQKQHEYFPIHKHYFLYSFVVFIKIPTVGEEQHRLPFRCPFQESTSNFQFVTQDAEIDFSLSPEDEGRILFFPSSLRHQVYPFFECEEDRITVSGNVDLQDPNRNEKQKMFVSEYEEKKRVLEMMEKSAEHVREELKQMKKVGK